MQDVFLPGNGFDTYEAQDKVLVGMSGGVDSSVAVRILQQQGFAVTGAVIRFSPAHEGAVEAARRSAEQLGIECVVLDAQDLFEKEVIRPFCADYCAGRTPNPCVVCNRTIKFGALLEEADKLGYPLLATGHYAQVERDENGLFAESLEAVFDQGPAVYENLVQEFPFLELEPSVRVKPLFFSRLQSILGFTGVYFPFTGEANVNIDAPACMIPATVAHEMAHQRMVASEQEANFVGIAAAVTSGDPVFQYSGYLFGLVQLCNALAPVDRDAWNAIVQQYFTQEMANDWNANNAYWAELSSPVEETAEQVYDSFLKGNDQELGIRSYGACVDLLVAYFGNNA